MEKDFEKWKEPLLRILEGHSELFQITSEFPKLGKLPPIGKFKDVLKGIEVTPSASAAAVAVVVVVVCVAVAARPGAVTSPELLKAKLLDVYTPSERKTLAKAIALVQRDPKLIKSCLGIDYKKLAPEFMDNLKKVQKALT